MDLWAAVGKDPHIAALANIGGILGLVVFLLSAARHLKARQQRISGSFRQRRVKRAKVAARDFRVAKRAKAARMTNAFIIEPELRQIVKEARWTFIYIVVAAFNTIVLVNEQNNLAAGILLLLYLIFLASSVQKITYLLNRALDKIGYSELPEYYWHNFKKTSFATFGERGYREMI